MADPQYIICMPTSGPHYNLASVVRWCSFCGCEVWLSEDMAVIDGLTPVCVECGNGVIEMQDEPEVRLHPAQHATLRAAGVLDDAQQMVAGLNREMRRRARRGRA